MKRFFLLCLVATFLSACKKDTKAEIESYLRLSVNGNPVTATKWLTHNYSSQKVNTIHMSGGWADGSNGSVDIDFINFPYTTGVWTVWTDKIVFQLWTPQYYSSTGGSNVNPNSPGAGSGKFAIIEINAEYMKGTFSFITDSAAIGQPKMIVTNGEFQIKRSN